MLIIKLPWHLLQCHDATFCLQVATFTDGICFCFSGAFGLINTRRLLIRRYTNFSNLSNVHDHYPEHDGYLQRFHCKLWVRTRSLAVKMSDCCRRLLNRCTMSYGIIVITIWLWGSFPIKRVSAQTKCSKRVGSFRAKSINFTRLIILKSYSNTI